jgi:transcriptional regulator with XRE-family HTH domain
VALKPGSAALIRRSGRRRGPVVGDVERQEPGTEFAMLAGISPDYYLRLEQGRDQHPSDQVLDALAASVSGPSGPGPTSGTAGTAGAT